MKSSVAALIWVGASAVVGVAAHGDARTERPAPTTSKLGLPFRPSTAFRCAVTLNGSSPTASTTLPAEFGFVLTSLTFNEVSQMTFGRLGSFAYGGRPRLRISVGNCIETHTLAAPPDPTFSSAYSHLDYNARVLRFDPPLVAFPNEFVSFVFEVDAASGVGILVPADSIGFVIGGYVVPPEDL